MNAQRPSLALRLALTVLFAGLWAGPTSAQLTSAGITGTLRDQTGGALPGVTITATHQETGRQRTTQTSDQGSFRIDGLPPGPYTVTAELAGFNTLERKDVILQGTAIATLDLALQVSDIAESVTVSGAAESVDLTQNQVKTQIERVMLDTLPVSGRRFQDYAFLAPGVSIDVGSTRSGQTDAIAFFGFNERFKSIYVDGVDLNDELTGGGTGITDAPRAQLSMEAIEEMEVLRNQFSAEVGRQQAGVINIITRSGTNDLRGRGFAFLRDDAFDKKNHFASGTLPFRQIQTGANVGGPIVKDRTHFFGSYELWDLKTVATIQIPPPLVPFLADPRTEIPATNTRHNFFGKFSHSFSPSQLLNVTYLHDRQEAKGQAAAETAAADARFNEKQRDHFVVGRLTSVVGKAAVNEARIAYSRSFTRRPVDRGRPELIFPGLRTGTPNNMPQGRTQRNFVLADIFTKQLGFVGDHALKFGGEINIVRYPTNLNLFQFGQFTFARAEPPGPSNPPIQYILGRYAFDFADLDSNFYGAFVQDDWKPTPRLTINLGVRYDLETYHGAYEGADYPAFSTQEDAIRFLVSTLPGGTNAGTIYKSREVDKNNVQPRVGFNWAATEDRKTSIRGGYGLFVEGGHDPISVQGTLRKDRAQTFVAPGALFPLLSFFPNEPPDSLLNQFFQISLVSQFPGVFVTSAFAHQTTVGFERQLPRGMTLAVDYAAIRSRENGRTVNVNHPNAQGVCPFIASCAAVNVNLSDGRISSDALQMQLRRRFQNRLGLLVSYTLMKAEEDGPSTSPFLRDRDFGPTPNDVRHRFSGSLQTVLPYGFNAAVIVTAASAFPYNVTAGVDTTGDRVPGSDRPESEPYNSRRADGYLSTDVRLGRAFRFGAGYQLDVMWEMFNLFNVDNFNNYVGAVRSPFFGQPVQALAPFQGQLGVRVTF